MSPEPETQKEPGSEDSIPKRKLDPEDFKDLSNVEQVNALFRNQVRLLEKMERIEEKLDDKEIVDNNHEENPLERFEDARVDEFRRRLKNAGNDGLTYTDLKKIFNRGKSVAYELMDDLPEHNSYIKKIERGPNQKNILVHEKTYLVEEIQDLAGSNIDDVVEQFLGEDLGDDSPEDVLEDQLMTSELRKLYGVLLSEETDSDKEKRSRAPSWM